MSDLATKIEWATGVWDPVTGCTKISEGCRNCYAERMAKRLRERCGYPADEPSRVTLHPERFEQPTHWKKPRVVFVSSMGDLFHEDVPDEFIDRVFSQMTAATRHVFLVLTKRPERMRNIMLRYKRNVSNVWLGVSVEDQKTADERIPILLSTPAQHLFISVEPMLGPVDLQNYIGFLGYEHCSGCVEGYDGEPDCPGHPVDGAEWVICGGESGPGARPMNPVWVRNLRDQCRDAEVPFFFKQWGEWAALSQTQRESYPRDPEEHLALSRNPFHGFEDGVYVYRVGRRRAGALLDGEVIQEWPRKIAEVFRNGTHQR